MENRESSKQRNSGSVRENLRFALRAMEDRNYRLFFWPQTVSLCGTWMQHTAQAWLVYRLSDSPAWLGIITFLTLFPIFLFSLWAGVMGDRHPRRWILWSVNFSAALQALVLGLFTLTGHISVPLVGVLASVLGVLNAFEIPTRQAFVLDLVSRENLPSAVALNSSSFNLARLVGPLAAGLLIPWRGEGVCFVVNALTYVPVLVSLRRLRLAPQDNHSRDIPVWKSLVGGLRYVASSSELRPVLFLLASASLFAVWFPSFLPVFAQDIHGSDPSRDPLILGMMVAAVGLGSLLGAYALAKSPGIQAMGKRIVGGAFGLSLGLPLFASVRNLPFGLVLLLILGFSMVSLNVGCNTLVQALAPDTLRGRITSLYTVSMLGIGPVGALTAGVAAEWIGVAGVMRIGGFALLVVTGWVALEVRRIPSAPSVSADSESGEIPENLRTPWEESKPL